MVSDEFAKFASEKTSAFESPSRRYSCKHCNKKFKKASDLANHIRWYHKKKKIFHCRVCNKQFNDNSSRIIHERLFKHDKLHPQKQVLSVSTNKMCEYGCEKKARFVLKCGRYCCSRFVSQCTKQKEKNSIGNKLKSRSNAGKSLCSVCDQMIPNTCFKKHQRQCHLTQENIEKALKLYYEYIPWEEIKRKTSLLESEMRKIFKGKKRELSNVMKKSHQLGRGNSWKKKRII